VIMPQSQEIILWALIIFFGTRLKSAHQGVRPGIINKLILPPPPRNDFLTYTPAFVSDEGLVFINIFTAFDATRR